MPLIPEAPVLVIVAGPNGSGKSELTRCALNLQYFPSDAYINPDEIAAKMPGGWHEQQNFLPAARRAQALRRQRLALHQDIVFETVFSSPEKIAFMQEARTCGYFVHLIFICTEDPAINAARVCRRVMENGHSVPIEKIVSRYFLSIQQASEAVSLVDVAHFFDNSLDGTAPRLVMEMHGRQIRHYGPQPIWMTRIDEACNLTTSERQDPPEGPDEPSSVPWVPGP